jgi:hypothetical protein
MAVVVFVLFAIVAAACSKDSTKTSSAATSATTSKPRASKVLLIDAGVDLPTGVVEFGAPMADAVKQFTATLGPPTEDTGLTEPRRPYGKCPGTKVRALRYYGGALELLFGDAGEKAVPGKFVFHSWVLTSSGTPSAAPRASVLIGDVTTFEFGVGTTVKEFTRGLTGTGNYSFEVFDGPTFVVSTGGNDPAPGTPASITGELTGDGGDAATAKLIAGGAGCSE